MTGVRTGDVSRDRHDRSQTVVGGSSARCQAAAINYGDDSICDVYSVHTRSRVQSQTIKGILKAN